MGRSSDHNYVKIRIRQNTAMNTSILLYNNHSQKTMQGNNYHKVDVTG